MLEGGSAKKFGKARELFERDRGAYNLLAGKLTAAVTEFLQMQIARGVDAVQIFDSLGGDVAGGGFRGGVGAVDGDDCRPAQRAGAGDRLFQGDAGLERAGRKRART